MYINGENDNNIVDIFILNIKKVSFITFNGLFVKFWNINILNNK